ncbi:hypothetical protein JOE54_001176 [Brachybacterium tyrofermentans]
MAVIARTPRPITTTIASFVKIRATIHPSQIDAHFRVGWGLPPVRGHGGVYAASASLAV